MASRLGLSQATRQRQQHIRHRADLTPLEHAHHVAEWIRLAEVSTQVGTKFQPEGADAVNRYPLPCITPCEPSPLLEEGQASGRVRPASAAVKPFPSGTRGVVLIREAGGTAHGGPYLKRCKYQPDPSAASLTYWRRRQYAYVHWRRVASGSRSATSAAPANGILFGGKGSLGGSPAPDSIAI